MYNIISFNKINNKKMVMVFILILIGCFSIFLYGKYREHLLEKEIASYCLLAPLAVAEKKIIISTTEALWQKSIEANVDFNKVINNFYETLKKNKKDGNQGNIFRDTHTKILSLEGSNSNLFDDYVICYVQYKNMEKFASSPEGNIIEYKRNSKKLYDDYDSACSKLYAKVTDDMLTNNFFKWLVKRAGFSM